LDDVAEGVATAVPDAAPTDRAARAAQTAELLLSELTPGPAGALEAFGQRLALLPVMYSCQIAFDTTHLVEKRSPLLAPVCDALVREAALLGAFHQLGGVLASSEWITEHGLPAREPEPRLDQLLGVARAFGWGHVSALTFTPGKCLVLRTRMTPECAYYAARYGPTLRPRLASLQGLALALMQLVHRVDFRAEHPITKASYDDLYRSGTRFHVEETCSPLRGDAFAEVVVEGLGSG
jgi:hypothetical protein